MNVKAFLFRLAIVLSAIGPCLLFLLFIFDASGNRMENLAVFSVPALGWTAFVWVCYWIACGLFVRNG